MNISEPITSENPLPRRGTVRSCSLRRSAFAALACAGLLLSGCTSTQVVALPVPSSPPPGVQVGSLVEVQLKSGQTLAFEATQFEPTAMLGKDVRVNYTDIASLKVKRFDKTRTITLGVTAEVALIAGLLFLLSQLGPAL